MQIHSQAAAARVVQQRCVPAVVVWEALCVVQRHLCCPHKLPESAPVVPVPVVQSVPPLDSLICEIGPYPHTGLLGELLGSRMQSIGVHMGHQHVHGALPHHCRRLAGPSVSRLRKTTCRVRLAT